MEQQSNLEISKILDDRLFGQWLSDQRSLSQQDPAQFKRQFDNELNYKHALENLQNALVSQDDTSTELINYVARHIKVARLAQQIEVLDAGENPDALADTPLDLVIEKTESTQLQASVAGVAEGGVNTVVHTAQGLWHTALHPIDTATAILNPDDFLMHRAAHAEMIQRRIEALLIEDPEVRTQAISALATESLAFAGMDMTMLGKATTGSLSTLEKIAKDASNHLPPNGGVAVTPEGVQVQFGGEAQRTAPHSIEPPPTLGVASMAAEGGQSANDGNSSAADGYDATLPGNTRNQRNVSGKGSEPAVQNAEPVYTAEQVAQAMKAAEAVDVANKVLEQARFDALKHDNPFVEALNASDGTHIDMATGQSIAEKTHFEHWTKSHAGERADFYEQLLKERPDIALEIMKQDPSMSNLGKLVLSPENDHLIGIQPYEGYRPREVARGYEGLAEQAKAWGIEWQKSTGFLDELKGGELAKNKPFLEAKAAVEASEILNQQLHADTVLRLMNPDRPMNPELAEKVAQVLHAQLEGGELSDAARQALPPELRQLPTVELVNLQQEVAPLVPDSLRLSSWPRQGALPSGTASQTDLTTVSGDAHLGMSLSIPREVQAQLRNDLVQSLLHVSEKDHATVSTVVQPSPTEVAAKVALDEVRETMGGKAAGTVLDTLSSDMGVGYMMGPGRLKELATKGAGSDVDAIKTFAKQGIGVGTKTLVVAGGGVAVATGVVGAAPAALTYVGVQVAKNALKHYGLEESLKGVTAPLVEKVQGATGTLNTRIKEASDYLKCQLLPAEANNEAAMQVAQNYLNMMEKLEKTPDGMRFTPESQAALKALDNKVSQSVIDESATTVIDDVIPRGPDR